MIKIAQITFNPFCENTYILIDKETNQCVIVDAGCYNEKEQQTLASFIEQHKLIPVLNIATHGHIDHIVGADFASKQWNIPYMIHSLDVQLVQSGASYASSMGFEMGETPAISAELADNQEIKLAENTIKIIHTPGHTPGGVSIFIPSQNQLLSGDTLFKESIGRTDLPGGDYNQIMNSILTRLIPLGSDIQIYPGHGPFTTLSHELSYNPFITEAIDGQVNYK
ncbi:MAG: MBL fold metallo-hydrolase [Mucinivorans sp.]